MINIQLRGRFAAAASQTPNSAASRKNSIVKNGNEGERDVEAKLIDSQDSRVPFHYQSVSRVMISILEAKHPDHAFTVSVPADLCKQTADD